jgi:3-deoxy-manno-octulosonate cytidylyltransferase (CMP-KDO synthetase)
LRVVIAIPARIGSTRLPAKALAEIAGEPMVVRVWRRCAAVPGVARVLVATDDARIRDAVRAAGGEAVLTRAEHPSGTDRIAEAVHGEASDLVINVQGDEPFIEQGPLQALIDACAAAPQAEAATLATEFADAAELDNPSVVKVRVGEDGYALWFSRRSIADSGEEGEAGLTRAGAGSPGGCWGCLRHIGVYAYRPDFLQRFTALAPTAGELSEHLEQLRILEHGYRILVVSTGWEPLAVDTPQDLERARARAARERR